MVELAGHGGGDVAQVLVAAVARAGHDHDAPSAHVQALRQVRHHADRVRVVRRSRRSP
jgi:hypothetical protein